MIKKIFFGIFGLVTGAVLGYLLILYRGSEHSIQVTRTQPATISVSATPKVIGFLPYWLTSKAQEDYSDYITNLTIFGLTIDSDGSIKKLTKPTEGEPGWVALKNGRFDDSITTAKAKGLELSLLFFASNEEDIGQLLSQPKIHAQTLADQAAPIMKDYGFTDFNLDIESIPEASDEARLRFTAFTTELKKQLAANGINSLTVEVTGTDFVKSKLIDVVEVSKIADYLVIMGYDYHYPGSYVTGPVAPLYGGGTESEYDVDTAVKQAMRIMPPGKIILGIPLYGYEWESLRNFPRAAVIPGGGVTASTDRVKELLVTCTTCYLGKDSIANEAFIVQTVGSIYHQIFFPDSTSTSGKIDYAKENNLGGLALWALGYEDSSVLEPLVGYK
ncbi:hypothetical protein A2115_00055 [Candidatus Woesebacteria bacterium GWA1_41_8]|uniref:chitinase n=1 Tax=Candidatus Woesebacteria bacterium GWA1_41_8 TaxID=1802471 RepID=A0A1F7WJ91_9BACT|nr:MAG: hypothetical protein A2115_00055 [Candidatus Woesebacteria bacterium GWA1_41_8]